MLVSHKKQMLLMMITGAFAIFFTGFVHVWSIYQPYVIAKTGWTETQASICFYLSSCMFVFGSILGGKIQDKKNPKVVIFLGGGLFALGTIFSSFLLIQSPIPMYLTFGIMQGIGQGMAYSVILATAQKWFPDRTGFASGIIVTANGLCAFILAPISRYLLEKNGPGNTLLLVGITMAIAWILVSLFLVVPQKEWVKKPNESENDTNVSKEFQAKQYQAKEMIFTKKFYFMVLTLMCGLMPYYLLSPISQTLQMGQGITATVAVGAVMCGSLLNAATRLILPTLADKVGRMRCIQAILSISLIAMIMLTFLSGYITTIAVVLTYISFGGIMGNFPSLTSSVFGLEHFGENYGYVMLGMVIASMGSPIISNMIIRQGAGTHILFGFGVGFAFLSLLILKLLQRSLGKQKI